MCCSVAIYIKYWFLAPCTVSAPQNDLSLLKDLQSYKSTNEELENVALEKFKNYLWYISEKLIKVASLIIKSALTPKEK